MSQPTNGFTLKELIKIMKDAQSKGYEPTVIINGEYYCIKEG